MTEAGRVRLPVTLGWVTALLACLLVLYTMLLPTYRAPDEPHHLDMVRKVREGYGYPELGSTFISEQVMASLPLVEFAARSRHLDSDAATPRSERPSLENLAPDVPSAQLNQMPQHPPLYYVVAAIQTIAISVYSPWLSGAAYDVEAGLYRLLNVLFVVPLPLLAFGAARRLSLSVSAALMAGLVPVAIPMLVHIGASVTNDNLVNLSFGVTTFLLVGVMRGDDQKKTAVLIGGVVAAGMLTKAFGLALVPFVGLGYLLGYLRVRSRQMFVSGLLAISLAAVAGGWWWLRNLLVHGAVIPASGIVREGPPQYELDRLWWVGHYLNLMNARFWGWFGWVDVRLPDTVLLIALVVTAGAAVAALFVRYGKGPTVSELLVLLFPVAILLLLVGWNSYGYYVESGVADRGIQGRYLFPGVVGLGVVVATGLSRLTRRYEALLPLAGTAVVLVIHVISVRRITGAFWGHPDASFTDRVSAMVAWAPWPPVVAAAVGVALALAIVGLIASTAIDARRQLR